MSKAVTKEQLADCLERIGDYFVQTNEDFTGASDSVAGAKGMVPAPSAGDDVKFLRGDGTWAEPAGGGGGGQGGSGECGVRLADVTNVGYDTATGKVTVTWTDPADVTLDGASLARWAGTKLVRKVGSAPADETDGTVVVDSKVRNQYATTGYQDTGLTDGTVYYYRLFPYTDVGSVTAGTGFNATPNKFQTTLTVTKTGDAFGLANTACEVATISTDGDGQLMATSSDDTVGTVSVSNGKVYVTPVVDGTITVSVSQLGGIEWSSAGPVAISVDVTAISTVLENNSWSTISAIAQAGNGDLYWDIGDTKEILLNGNITIVGDASHLNYDTHSNHAVKVFILDFNHPIKKTTDDNNIIFGGFKDSNGDDIGIGFDGYGGGIHTPTWSNGLNNPNVGWGNCEMRTLTLGADSLPSSPTSNSLLAALPSDLRSIMRQWEKYASNTSASSFTSLTDSITLLAEYEIFGQRTYANSAEQNYQQQMAYYVNGNSKIKKNYKTKEEYGWWTSSVKEAGMFCMVSYNGQAIDSINRMYELIAPAFKV